MIYRTDIDHVVHLLRCRTRSRPLLLPGAELVVSARLPRAYIQIRLLTPLMLLLIWRILCLVPVISICTPWSMLAFLFEPPIIRDESPHVFEEPQKGHHDISPFPSFTERPSLFVCLFAFFVGEQSSNGEDTGVATDGRRISVSPLISFARSLPSNTALTLLTWSLVDFWDTWSRTDLLFRF